ncbi:MAG: cytochrome c oxidase accessory protein CcoG [Sulfurospirillum sp.]|nr:cytochrome c oxidase accessory protein CcoG [Sulfurospirillum sp.]
MACSSGSCGVKYDKKRYIGYAIITIVALMLPFLRVDDKHFFLLNFDKKQLHLLFTSFDMQELYLMPFLLILLFLGVFFMTTLGGRVWCGWACPQTIFRTIYRDLIETKLLGLRKNTNNKQKNPKEGFEIKKLLALLIWSVLAFLAASNFLWYFIPPEDYFAYLQEPSQHVTLLIFLASITGFLIYDAIILKEDFCVYICPYARVQSVMFDEDTILPIYDTNRGGDIYDAKGTLIATKPTGQNDECTGCEACVRICPTHIDIRKGMQLECINCLECVDACTKVMGKLGKETLISWTSTNQMAQGGKVKYLRFRTIAYSAALVLALVGLLLMGSTKEHMLLNINRTSQLFKINENTQKVENVYTFLFQNTTSRDHTYYIEVLNKNIEIKKPAKPFVLKAGKKSKEIVILFSDISSMGNNDKNVVVPIQIKAFAVDDKENISILRDTNFVYPSKKEIDEKIK